MRDREPTARREPAPGTTEPQSTTVAPLALVRLPGIPNSRSACDPAVYAARLSAIEGEVRWFADPRFTPKPEPSIWRRPLFGETGPVAIIRRKAARFRMPRRLKSELIDRFASSNAEDLAMLTSVIVVAHPDDESIGAGSRLGLLGDAWVVAVTDGAPRDDACARAHGFETREAYAAARECELRQALGVVGFPMDRLVKLDFVDGEATLRLVELCLRVAEIIDRIRPQVVVTHPYEGGHTDHDATAFAVHLACGILRREQVPPPAILELASYHSRNGRRVVQQFLPHAGADREQRVLRLDTEQRARKQRMFACFATQAGVLDQFSTHLERFRPAPRYVFTEPPHPGVLNYERYGHPERGRSWREHADQVLRLLRMRRD